MNNRRSLQLLAEQYEQVLRHMDEGWVDPKTGRFVAPGTPGAVERKGKASLSQTPNAIKKRAARAATSGTQPAPAAPAAPGTTPQQPAPTAAPAAPGTTPQQPAPTAAAPLPNDIKMQLDKLNVQQKQQLLQLLAA